MLALQDKSLTTDVRTLKTYFSLTGSTILKRIVGWLPLVLFITTTLIWFPDNLPRWAWMWTIGFAIYFGLKWLTWWTALVTGASLRRNIAYWFAWPGMDATAFLSDTSPTYQPHAFREWLAAGSKLLIGIVLFYGIARLVPSQFALLQGWIGMIGFSLITHFGLLNLTSCLCSSFGLNAKLLMNRPLYSTSVNEFWSKRWNLAFRDLAYQQILKPMQPRFGSLVALWTVFLFSGLIHELIISIPAGAGYGGPLIYFALQALAISLERTPMGRRLLTSSRWRGWLFTAVVVIGPVYWLFHRPFVENIVLPFMSAVGAI